MILSLFSCNGSRGGYRKPTEEQRRSSMIPKDKFNIWFQQFYRNLTGASTKEHPAPFPLELASRLVQMFSFTGDTVVDPFCGTATTMIAALKYGRNSIGLWNFDSAYCKMAASRLQDENMSMFGNIQLEIELKPHSFAADDAFTALSEKSPDYKITKLKKTVRKKISPANTQINLEVKTRIEGKRKHV